MKNLLTVVFCIFVLFSCEQENFKGIKDSESFIQYKELKNQNLKIAAEKFLNSKSFKNLKAEGDLNFDLEHLQLIENEKNNTSIIGARQIKYDENTNEKFAIGFKQDELGNIIGAIITKTIKVSDEIAQIEYYTSDGDLIAALEVNANEKAVKVLTKKSTSAKSISECGDDTIDCVETAYSDLGWGSVTLVVLSAFDPLVPVGLAAGCAFGCLLW